MRHEGKKKKKRRNTLCSRGISAAKSKFDVYPSTPMVFIQVCKGKIKGLDGKNVVQVLIVERKRNNENTVKVVNGIGTYPKVMIHTCAQMWKRQYRSLHSKNTSKEDQEYINEWFKAGRFKRRSWKMV